LYLLYRIHEHYPQTIHLPNTEEFIYYFWTKSNTGDHEWDDHINVHIAAALKHIGKDIERHPLGGKESENVRTVREDSLQK